MHSMTIICRNLRDRLLRYWEARFAVVQPEVDSSRISDGFHTFAELYEHRHALCLALMHAIPQHCWFSWRHADGEPCFGGDKWFIVGFDLPGGSTVTYHLPADLYLVAQATGAAEMTQGLPWDGHTSVDVPPRLRDWAAMDTPDEKMASPIVALSSLPQRWAEGPDGAMKPVISKIHVLPLEYGGSLLHCAQTTCWCSPSIDPDDDCLVIHNAVTSAGDGWVLVGELET
jgi:hypothetical protein